MVQSQGSTSLDATALPSWAVVSLNLDSLNEFVVVDVETNGLESKTDSMLSIAAVRFIKGKVAASFYSLMKPSEKTVLGGYINEEACAVNKITEELLENAPTEKEVMEAFSKFVGTSTVVGHNLARFDARFIDKALKRHKISSSFGWQMFDTFAIARSVGGFEKNSLEVICRTLKIPNLAAHHALADCLATGELMVHFVKNHYEKVVRNQFMISERLRSEHIDSSPVTRTIFHALKIAEAGSSPEVSRLCIAQTIEDFGGTYLHNPLVGTNMFLQGDIEAEEKIVRRTSKFGGPASRVSKAKETNSRLNHSIEFITLDHFAKYAATPYLDDLVKISIDVETHPETVTTFSGVQSLESLWSDWADHVATVDDKTEDTVSVASLTDALSNFMKTFS